MEHASCWHYLSASYKTYAHAERIATNTKKGGFNKRIKIVKRKPEREIQYELYEINVYVYDSRY